MSTGTILRQQLVGLSNGWPWLERVKSEYRLSVVPLLARSDVNVEGS